MQAGALFVSFCECVCVEGLTCWQREGHQVSEEVACEVSFALVEGSRHLTPNLLRQLGTHHGRDALGRLLGNLWRTRMGFMY